MTALLRSIKIPFDLPRPGRNDNTPKTREEAQHKE